MNRVQFMADTQRKQAASVIVAAEQLGKLATDRSRWLVQEMNWEIRAGDRWALEGPSGAGKSLLLQLLAGLLPPDEGQISWRGTTLSPTSMPQFRADVMLVGQRVTVFEGTVAQNLQLPFRFAAHRHRVYDEQRVKGWLTQLRRGNDFLLRRHDQVSGGESQTVALLRALQLDPSVLLLDEPTSALDPKSAQAVEQLILAWQAELPEVRTCVWVTHDRAQADRVSDRAVRLSN